MIYLFASGNDFFFFLLGFFQEELGIFIAGMVVLLAPTTG